jgi:hypothetical protein
MSNGKHSALQRRAYEDATAVASRGLMAGASAMLPVVGPMIAQRAIRGAEKYEAHTRKPTAKKASQNAKLPAPLLPWSSQATLFKGHTAIPKKQLATGLVDAEAPAGYPSTRLWGVFNAISRSEMMTADLLPRWRSIDFPREVADEPVAEYNKRIESAASAIGKTIAECSAIAIFNIPEEMIASFKRAFCPNQHDQTRKIAFHKTVAIAWNSEDDPDATPFTVDSDMELHRQCVYFPLIDERGQITTKMCMAAIDVPWIEDDPNADFRLSVGMKQIMTTLQRCRVETSGLDHIVLVVHSEAPRPSSKQPVYPPAQISRIIKAFGAVGPPPFPVLAKCFVSTSADTDLPDSAQGEVKWGPENPPDMKYWTLTMVFDISAKP